MTDSKIQGKFYPLQHKEWLRACRELTPAEIDVASEVNEIKNINDCKEALGKILADSAFFPEHSKRIHLFGRSDLTKLALAQATCSQFGIIVTFELVEGGYE